MIVLKTRKENMNMKFIKNAINSDTNVCMQLYRLTDNYE